MFQLHDKIKSAIDYGTAEIPEIPEYVTSNLRYIFYDWQREAFEYFLVNENKKNIEESTNNPTHLMFNLATGTGKTLLMAAAILYYYKQGYRHFLFFVNANNIVDKTENNFLDKTHNKYLFEDRIVIDDKTVEIKDVETFSDNPQSIEIKFTTIQKLYNDVHIERENQTTLDDLHKLDIVMIADEAHHLNTDTKSSKQYDIHSEITNRTGTVEVERKGWEHTVISLILQKNGKRIDNKNILLEFTATIPQTESIAQKYEDKIIYKFGLKEFLQAGYTKEINLISSTLDTKERVLHALVFAWFRHKIAIKYGIANFKPVVLFRSKTIEESNTNYEEFLNWMHYLSADDLRFLDKVFDKIPGAGNYSIHEMAHSRTEQVIKYIRNENITYSEIADWIKLSFCEKNIIITNSKANRTNTEKTDEDTEKLLNSLEDKGNSIRAIFTVSRLTEGWDVLNLYDIVRLYETRDTGKTKTGRAKAGSSTIAEKQLIGRGVRYFPFEYNNKIKNKRKFDNDIFHEMRILEELYFHSISDHRYIDELKRELRKDGYITDDKTMVTFNLKMEFKESEYYNKTKLWYNELIDNPKRRKNTVENISNNYKPYETGILKIEEQNVPLGNDNEKKRLSIKNKERKRITKKISEIDKHIFRKAINIKAKRDNSLFRYENLQKELKINSIDELQTNILKDHELSFIVNSNIMPADIDNQDVLNHLMGYLEYFFSELSSYIAPKIGSDFTHGSFDQFFADPKTKALKIDSEQIKINDDYKDEDWYVLDKFYGTVEEESLVKFIKESIGNLKDKFNDFYLLRNEEVYKIFDFEKGRGFEPDFLLFLRSNQQENKNNIIFYQIFIEAKGNQFIGEDGKFRSGKEGWKEKFLEQICKRYGLGNIVKNEDKNYILYGLPFFNKDYSEKEFIDEFNKVIK